MQEHLNKKQLVVFVAVTHRQQTIPRGHLVAIRIFVESILRYGLPPQFQVAVVKPHPKAHRKLRDLLAANFGTAGAVHWKESDLSGDDSKAGPGLDSDTFPYVSLTIDLGRK